MSKITYVKCPRCELNYIDERNDMCDICKAELNLAPNNLLEDYDDEKELCPVCKINFIDEGEKMCSSCAEAREEAIERENDNEDDSWLKEFVDEPEEDDEDEQIEIPLEELQDDEYNDRFDDEEEVEVYHDDFEELGDVDDIEDIDDEDEEDDF